MKLLLVVVLVLPSLALGVEYDCKVERKVGSKAKYDWTKKQIRNQPSVRIRDDGATATLSRCDFLSQNKVTCDTHQVDKIAADEVVRTSGGKVVPGEWAYIKKYYVFRGQFDVQVFDDLTFVENDGRGGIAFGKCRITSP